MKRKFIMWGNGLKDLIENYDSANKNIALLNENLKEAKEHGSNMTKILEENKIKNNNVILEKNEEINKIKNELKNVKDKLRKSNGGRGGLTSKIKKQEAEIEDLKEKLKESMTDKYIVKKFPKTKAPAQRMKVKHSELNSKIITKILS